MEFKDFGLVISGEEKFINKRDSIVIIDGNEYYAKDFLYNLIPTNSNLTPIIAHIIAIAHSITSLFLSHEKSNIIFYLVNYSSAFALVLLYLFACFCCLLVNNEDI